jgi:hypothetical protein
MNILIIIILIIAGIIALLLIIALLMKREHDVKREIIINAPRQKVFDYLRFLKNQDTFNTGAMAGADREQEFTGTDGTVGYIYAWKGDKDAGEGEKEIINIVEGESIEMEIRFIKPMVTSARIIMDTKPLSGNETKVYWSNGGTLKYPVNIMIPILEKHVVRDIDTSLSALKNILENNSEI